jgi:hypothetical protein
MLTHQPTLALHHSSAIL